MRYCRRSAIIAIAFFLAGLPTIDHVLASRVKDIASIHGVRSNQLLGYGLVVGLNGTGDDQQVYFTLRSVQLMLRRLGVQAADERAVNLRNLRLKNTAAVMVTANLPPFSRSGSRLDVTVSSLGNAKSLRGGTLLLTPLRGVDLKVYALAQGALSIGGAFVARGRSGSRIRKNHTTAATIPHGALLEREVSTTFVTKNKMSILLSRPDFTTALRIAQAINKALGSDVASASDPGAVSVSVPKPFQKKEVEFIAQIEAVNVDVDSPAQVILNEKTGTVIVGERVTISPVAISHGGLTLEIGERFRVSQPNAPLSQGSTQVVPQSAVRVDQPQTALNEVPASASLSDVVKALNALGASPRDLIAIFQSLEQSGALSAKVIVQ